MPVLRNGHFRQLLLIRWVLKDSLLITCQASHRHVFLWIPKLWSKTQADCKVFLILLFVPPAVTWHWCGRKRSGNVDVPCRKKVQPVANTLTQHSFLAQKGWDLPISWFFRKAQPCLFPKTPLNLDVVGNGSCRAVQLDSSGLLRCRDLYKPWVGSSKVLGGKGVGI